MLKIQVLRPEFVQHLPDSLNEGVLYISEEFATAGHRCCCGCGEEVITPLNPAQWQLSKAGVGVSLYPSVGNWKFACRSHYWIKNGRVIEAGQMSEAAIDRVKKRDRKDKDAYIQSLNSAKPKHSILRRLLRWLGGN